MKVLALDQSLQTTGWAVFNNGKLVKFSHFTIPANKPIEIRLHEIWYQLDELLNEYEFSKLYFEDIQMQRNNAMTFKKLAYVQATILLWCYNQNIKCEILSASHWRSIIKDRYKVSFGRARAEQKKVALELVLDKFADAATEDEADAILLGVAALAESKQKETIEFE